MRTSWILLTLSMLLATTVATAQTVTWNLSGPGSFNAPANWTPQPNGLVDDGNGGMTLDPGSLINSFVIDDEFASVYIASNADDGTDNVFSTARLNSLTAGADLSLTINRGDVKMAEWDPFLGELPDDGGFQGDGDDTYTETLILNGGSFQARFLSQGLNVVLNAGLLYITGGGNGLNTVELAFGGDLSGTLQMNETPEDFVLEHLGKITVNGLPAAIGGNLEVLGQDIDFDANGDLESIVTVVENPAGAGDLNRDGSINVSDWNILNGNLYTELLVTDPVLRFDEGDMNNDGFVDERDFGIFKDAYTLQSGPGAFAALVATTAVPEPSALLLCAVCGLSWLGMNRNSIRKNHVMRKQVTNRLLSLLVFVSAIAASTQSYALVTWTGAGADPNAVFADDNYDFAASSLSEISPGAAFDNDVNVILDNVTYTDATIVATDFTGFGRYQIGDGYTATFDNSSFTTNASGGFAGIDDDPESSIGVPSYVDLVNGSFVNAVFATKGVTFNVDASSTLQLRGGGNPLNNGGNEGANEPSIANLAVGAQLILASVPEFNEQAAGIFVNGISHADTRYSILSIDDNTNTATAITPVVETLVLEVDPDGNAALVNASSAPIEMDLYKVLSPGGNLDTSFTGIQGNDQSAAGFPAGPGTGAAAGTGWEKAGGSDASELGESFAFGTSTLANDGTRIELGDLFNVVDDQEALDFVFRNVVSGQFERGVIKFVDPSAGLVGDFNGDGTVNLADYTVWRNNLGAAESVLANPGNDNGFVDAGDYTEWKNNFGMTSGAGAAIASPSAVPEPATWLLATLTGLALLRRRVA